MFPNNLIKETSPYLLQHAHNPVNWYAWGEDAFQKARNENKPILVSIGYAACHWCHVMEHESFEDEQTAVFMNDFFVNIKVDREERFDVDHIYMNACQLLTGAGGWPLNMFLTPDLKPFTGGTYFPLKPAYGKPSWMDVLVFVHEQFTRHRDKVEEQAQLLSEHILKMDDLFIAPLTELKSETEIFSKNELLSAIKNMKLNFDQADGGFGNAPKFPAAMNLRFLLKTNYFLKDKEIEAHVLKSLDKMMQGGIYDQIGGGFARYTVDNKWMVPHFEKMLYDNALLINLYAEAFTATKREDYKNVVEESLQFIEREMMHPDGGFYASYDADSEGVEGKFYTWTKNEIDEILKSDSEFVCRLYSVSEAGNWEHTNILHRTISNEKLCEEFHFTPIELFEKIKAVNTILFEEREKKIKPGLDYKIILSWNALMISAFVNSYYAIGNEHYRVLAENAYTFIKTKFNKSGLEYFHTCQKGNAKYPAFLEDYAALINATLDIYELTNEFQHLQFAIELSNYVVDNFSDGPVFYFTHKNQTDLPLRNKDFYDNATPSGNSIMLENFLRMATYTSENEWMLRAENLFSRLKTNIIKHGTSFGNWLCAAGAFIYPPADIVITGKNAETLAQQIREKYYPYRSIRFNFDNHTPDPVFENRLNKNEDLIYLCRHGECQLPVNNLSEFFSLLNEF